MRVHLLAFELKEAYNHRMDEDSTQIDPDYLKHYHDELLAIFPNIDLSTLNSYNHGKQTMANDDQLIKMTLSPKISFNVIDSVSQSETDGVNLVTSEIDNLLNKMSVFQTKLDGNHLTFNSKCEVHTPGNSLTMYNSVQVVEDKCTDELQELLNEGWRIIAACPQPDQRRPDYILGKYNPNMMD